MESIEARFTQEATSAVEQLLSENEVGFLDRTWRRYCHQDPMSAQATLAFFEIVSNDHAEFMFNMNKYVASLAVRTTVEDLYLYRTELSVHQNQ